MSRSKRKSESDKSVFASVGLLPPHSTVPIANAKQRADRAVGDYRQLDNLLTESLTGCRAALDARSNPRPVTGTLSEGQGRSRVVALALLFLCGLMVVCGMTGCDQPPTAGPNVKADGQTVGKVAGQIGEKSKNIEQQADAWQVKAPSAEHHAAIKSDAAVIASQAQQLRDIGAKLEDSQKNIDRYIQQYNDALRELDDRNAWLYTVLTIIGCLCVAGGIAIIVTPLGSIIGRWVGGAAGVFGAGLVATVIFTRAMDRAINEWRDFLMWGAISCVCVVGMFGVWMLWTHRQALIDYARNDWSACRPGTQAMLAAVAPEARQSNDGRRKKVSS